jgi:hypothetical protein
MDRIFKNYPKKVGDIEGKPGKNDIKAIIEALNLGESLDKRAKKAFDLTNILQHDRKAGKEKAKACFEASANEMAEIIKTRFESQYVV